MWKAKYTIMVGRNRKNAVRTAENGISNRGKAMFITNRPPPVIEAAPAVMQFEMK
jgi:hypothetical protein